jgi:predicted secreted protein
MVKYVVVNQVFFVYVAILSFFLIFGFLIAEAKENNRYVILPLKENNIYNITAITADLGVISETNIVNLAKGQEHVISLSTSKGGFDWHADPGYNKTVIDVSERYESPSSKIPGSGSTVLFTIKALETGSTNFELIQKRDWEINTHQIIQYKINVYQINDEGFINKK